MILSVKRHILFGTILLLTICMTFGAISVHAVSARAAAVQPPAAGFVRLEAEDGIVNLGNIDGSEGSFSGTGLVRGMSYKVASSALPEKILDASYVNWRFTLDAATSSTLHIGYSGSESGLKVALIVNDKVSVLSLPAGASWDSPVVSAPVSVSLQAGANSIYVTGPLTDGSANAWVDLDYIDLALAQKPELDTSDESGEQIWTDLGNGMIRYEPTYKWNMVKRFTAAGEDGVDTPMAMLMSPGNSRLTFRVEVAQDGYYPLRIRYLVDRFVGGFPMHEISVKNGDWQTESLLNASGILSAKTPDLTTDSSVLYYPVQSINKWNAVSSTVYLKAGVNELTLTKPNLKYQNGSSFTAVNCGDITIDYLTVGGESDTAEYIDTVENLSKIFAYSQGVVATADGLGVANTSTDTTATHFVTYKTEADITAFRLFIEVQHQDYFGRIWTSKTGNDNDWQAVTYYKTPRLYSGNGPYRLTMVFNESAIAAGARYLKIELPNVWQEDNLTALHADQQRIRLTRTEIRTDTKTALQLSTPTAHQVVQRGQNNTADLAVSGVCRMAAASVTVTLRDKAGAPVGGFTDVSAAVNGDGMFSVTLQNVPAGLYDVSVSAGAGDNKTTVSAKSVGIGDVWIIAGQSNSAGNAKRTEDEADLFEEPVDGLSIFYPDTQQWVLAEQPIGENKGQADYSSLALSFAKNVYAKTGLPVGVAHTGVGGTSITKWSLSKSGFLYEYQLRSCFIKNDWNITGVLWNQGTTDCNQYFTPTPASIGLTNPHDDTCTVYEYRFADFVKNLRSDFGNENLPVITFQIGHTNSENAYWAHIREVQRAVASDNSVHRIPGVYVVPSNDGILWDNWLHNSMGTNQVIASRLANIALAEVYGYSEVTDYLFPDIRRAVKFSSNQILLEFDNVPNGFTALGDFREEFNVTAPSGSLSIIQAAEIVGEKHDKILLTMRRDLKGTETVGGLSNAVIDSINLRTDKTRYPILSFYGIPLSAADTVDTAPLTDTIARAEQFAETEYTAASFGALTEALQQARQTLANVYDLTQQRADSAVSALESAIAGLQKAPDPTPNPETPSDTPPKKGCGSALGASVGFAAVSGGLGMSAIALLCRRRRRADGKNGHCK